MQHTCVNVVQALVHEQGHSIHFNFGFWETAVAR